jgi:hypothetical protein
MAELESIDRLNNKLSEFGVNNLKIFPGGKWKDLSVSERADCVLEILEQVERGEFVTCDFAALDEMNESVELPEDQEPDPTPPKRAA